MEEKKQNGNMVLLTVLGVATLLASIAGLTFSFFTAQVTRQGNENAISVQTATVGITYNNGSSVTSADLLPDGTIPTKLFTIENTSTVAAKYSINWVSVVNTFARQDMKFSVACTGTGAPTAINNANMPATGATVSMIGTTNLPAGVTHNCTLTITYEDPDVNQDVDKNKTFSANLDIVPDQL